MTEIIDVKTLSDDDLATMLDAYRAEYQRRRDLGKVLETTPGLIEAYLDSTGRESGAQWVQPTGYHDAYPEGWEVTWDDKLWVSLVSGNVWEPGVSGWREQVSEGEVAAWVQPSGAEDSYPLDAIVSHNNTTWVSIVENNVWEPGVYGWEELKEDDGSIT